MKLLKLVLRNFKGIKHFELDTRGGNASIFGDNATGKTTLFDAFNWLLFDKDSQNKKDFKIKMLDSSNNEIHHLDHEVEAVLDHNDQAITLKKVYAENWSKTRGSVVSNFSGHKTDYYIDGVPSSKKAYDSFIGGIIDENVFKLLTNPAYFNEQLHWQDRRKTLLEICGDISDEEVIASDEKLAKLPSILGNRSLEDQRKVIQSRQAAINKELKEIPARIDEVQRGLPDISGIFNREVIETEIASLKKQQQAKQQGIVRIENGGEVAEKQKALREVEGRLIDIKSKHRSNTQDKAFEKKQKLQELNLTIRQNDSLILEKTRSIEKNQGIIKTLTQSCEDMRQDWYKTNELNFEFTHETVCPTCKQHLPEEQLASVREKALADFNLNKSKRLEMINSSGKDAKVKIEKLQTENLLYQDEIDKLTAEKSVIEQAIAALQAEIDAMTATATPAIENHPEYQKAMSELDSIKRQIEAINTEKQGVVRQLQGEINILNQDIASRDRSISQLDAHDRNLKRIDELKAQEEMLSAEYEKLTGELYLTEQFIRTKVNLLENRINSKFKIARFKLFDVQVNGGVAECCETLGNGVPYSSGLNNAARINVGLDIINTLSDHYGFTAPIFVDNREAVTKLIETKAQVISLVVSEPDKVLRVEYEGNALKEAV